MMRQPTGQDGFTLLEVVVALTILVIGLTAVFAGTFQAQRATRHAAQVCEATVIAEGILAEACASESPPLERSGCDRSWWWTLSVKVGPQAGLQLLAVSLSESPSGVPVILTLIGIRSDRSLPQKMVP